MCWSAAISRIVNPTGTDGLARAWSDISGAGVGTLVFDLQPVSTKEAIVAVFLQVCGPVEVSIAQDYHIFLAGDRYGHEYCVLSTV